MSRGRQGRFPFAMAQTARRRFHNWATSPICGLSFAWPTLWHRAAPQDLGALTRRSGHPCARLPLTPVGATAKSDIDHGDNGRRHCDHVAGEGENVQCLIHDVLFLPLEAIGPAGTAYRHETGLVSVVLGVLVCSAGMDIRGKQA